MEHQQSKKRHVMPALVYFHTTKQACLPRADENTRYMSLMRGGNQHGTNGLLQAFWIVIPFRFPNSASYATLKIDKQGTSHRNRTLVIRKTKTMHGCLNDTYREEPQEAWSLLTATHPSIRRCRPMPTRSRYRKTSEGRSY